MALGRVFQHLCPTGAHRGHDRTGPDCYSAQRQRPRTQAEMGTDRGGKPGVLWAGGPEVLWCPLVPHMVGLITRHSNGMVPTVWSGWYLTTVDASLGSVRATLCDNGSGKSEALLGCSWASGWRASYASMVLPGTASAGAPYEYLSVQPIEMVFMQFTVTDTNGGFLGMALKSGSSSIRCMPQAMRRC